jgi:hypothetical protein
MENSMEYHGKYINIWRIFSMKIFLEIPWNFLWNSMKFHGIFPMEFYGKFHEFTERFSPGQLHTTVQRCVVSSCYLSASKRMSISGNSFCFRSIPDEND